MSWTPASIPWCTARSFSTTSARVRPDTVFERRRPSDPGVRATCPRQSWRVVSRQIESSPRARRPLIDVPHGRRTRRYRSPRYVEGHRSPVTVSPRGEQLLHRRAPDAVEGGRLVGVDEPRRKHPLGEDTRVLFDAALNTAQLSYGATRWRPSLRRGPPPAVPGRWRRAAEGSGSWPDERR